MNVDMLSIYYCKNHKVYNVYLYNVYVYNGRIAQLVEQRARNRKVASSNPVKAYQTFHPSEVDKLVPVVVWPSGLRRGLSM